MPVKQVIVIRADLKLRRGKECAQVAHASGMWMLKKIVGSFSQSFNIAGGATLAEVEWLRGNYRKIVLKGTSEKQLRDLHFEAQNVGLIAHLVIDDGLTEVPPGTITALAIGPDEDAKIDAITKHLSLY